MGLLSPQEAAPAYEDVVHNHTLSNLVAPASGSGYAAVPQEDDLEQNAHNHNSPSPTPQPSGSLAQTIASVFQPKPHVHCQACDAQKEARERREQQKHCCVAVSWVFIMLFLCGMILGIVIVKNMGGSKSRRHT